MAGGIKRCFLPIILKIKEIRGKEAEEKVKDALEEIKREGKIINFGQTEKFGLEDLRGIDFIIFWRPSRKIFIQVKGYLDREEQKKYKGRRIHVIVVLPEDDVETAKKKILGILKRIKS